MCYLCCTVSCIVAWAAIYMHDLQRRASRAESSSFQAGPHLSVIYHFHAYSFSIF